MARRLWGHEPIIPIYIDPDENPAKVIKAAAREIELRNLGPLEFEMVVRSYCSDDIGTVTDAVIYVQNGLRGT